MRILFYQYIAEKPTLNCAKNCVAGSILHGTCQQIKSVLTFHVKCLSTLQASSLKQRDINYIYSERSELHT